MQEPFPIPLCFSAGEKLSDYPTSAATKSGHSVVISVYRTKIAGLCRLITVTWCKNLLVHGLTVAIEGSEGGEEDQESNSSNYKCKVDLKPWYFWRRHGSKRFVVDGTPVDVFWDLRGAKFSGESEPRSDYYVAVVSDDEVVLLLGNLKKDAYRRTGFRPSIIDAALVSKKEHVFGKKRFATRAKFLEKDKLHDILIECNNNGSSSSIAGNIDPEMVIKIDGHEAIRVKHLQWKFRGNESISIDKAKVEVYWDAHDWLFVPGLRHALFIFKPASPSPPCSSATTTVTTSPSSSSSLSSIEWSNSHGGGSSGSCLFLYAWKME